MKWSRVQLVVSIVTAAGLWQTLRERIGFACSSTDPAPKDDAGRTADLPSHYDVVGVLHVHSTYSDGTGTVEQIAEAAARAGVDFVLLTDHSTLAARVNGQEGRHAANRVLVAVGTEISTDCGHLLVLNVPSDFDVRPHSAAEIMRSTSACGGFGFIALPCDLKDHWRDFAVRADGFGIEVFNLSSIARTKINIPAIVLALGRYLGKRPISAFSYVAGRPARELRLWDKLCSDAFAAGRRSPNTIGSLDAHAVVRFGGRSYHYPTYDEVFRTLRTHLLISEPLSHDRGDASRDLDLVHQALRRGHSYVSYDNYGDGSGFSFQVRTEKECVANMGDLYHIDLRWPAHFDVRSPSRRSIIAIYRNGQQIARQRGQRLRIPVNQAGVYRVEVVNYCGRIGPVCVGTHPWIFSNPIEVKSASS